MEEILYQYKQIDRTTWVYVSSLMTIGIYFKFSRFWSVRNLDLVALVMIAPGLLLIGAGPDTEEIGYAWLFCVGLFFVIRLLIDPMMVRRPLLEPNLSVGGMVFMLVSLYVFLMAEVATREVSEQDYAAAQQLEQLIENGRITIDDEVLADYGPGYPMLHLLGSVAGQPLVLQADLDPESYAMRWHRGTTRTLAILSHLAIVAGLVFIGARHFGNVQAGAAAASLYLLLPYTVQLVGRVDHVLPAALLVWAIAAYRRPLIAGFFIALATAAIFFPVFLLPLWIGFYWQRGLLRFLAGFVVTMGLVVASLALTSMGADDFLLQLKQLVGWSAFRFDATTVGFWEHNELAYRIPVLTTFIILCFSFALWPAQKNLGTLLSCSAAVMLGAQFWHAQQGGLFVGWYLPLLLLTIFRPNLEDRVALSVLGEGWFTRRRTITSRAA